MKRTGLIIAAIVVLALAAGALAMTRNSNNKDNTATDNSTIGSISSNTTQESRVNNVPAAEPETANTITYSNDGFSPATLTVKAGTKVTVTNSSSRTIQFYSDPHPTHTTDSDLNLGSIKAGESKTLTANKKGSHGYHNHLNPGDTGTITVE